MKKLIETNRPSDSIRESCVNRRLFLERGIGAGLLLHSPFTLSAINSPSLSTAAGNDHFFLQILIEGGVDYSYLFDARPWEMTTAGLIQNYREKSADSEALWTSDYQGRALVTKDANRLSKWRPYFSVLNGVHMAADFDGHPQNLNLLLTGNPFGGAALMGQLDPHATLPLSFVQTTPLYADITNKDMSLTLSNQSAQSLAGKVRLIADLPDSDAVLNFAKTRFDHATQNSSSFAQASLAAAKSSTKMRYVAKNLSGIQLEAAGSELNLILQLFRKNLSKAGVLQLQTENGFAAIDTHDAPSAKNQPTSYGNICEQLDNVFQVLSATPFDDQRSMLEVTTIMIASEFGRTMRQFEQRIDDTGTDHNSLCASVILAGKGIKPGLVIGASDFQSQRDALSVAHISKDPLRLKTMGMPIDFDTMTVRRDLPTEYRTSDYLHISSVANTLYRLFGIDDSLKWTADRNSGLAKELPLLLS